MAMYTWYNPMHNPMHNHLSLFITHILIAALKVLKI